MADCARAVARVPPTTAAAALTRARPNKQTKPQWPKVLNAPLADVDPDLYDIIEKEKNRQFKVRACGERREARPVFALCAAPPSKNTTSPPDNPPTKKQKNQNKGLELIPSENFVSSSVMEAVGSVMTNKYSEGYPGARCVLLLWAVSLLGVFETRRGACEQACVAPLRRQQQHQRIFLQAGPHNGLSQTHTHTHKTPPPAL